MWFAFFHSPLVKFCWIRRDIVPLTALTVSTHLTDYDKIKHLYHTTFPEDELIKWSWLLRKSHSKNVEFLAYYDHNEFIGFSYMIHQPELDFLFFLAVAPQHHSKGYGGQILDWLNTKHPDTPIVLEAEPLDDKADNLEQRKRRLAFYQAHDYHDTKHRVTEDGVEYAVLTNQESIDLKILAKIYRWFFRPFNWRHQVSFK